MFSEGDRVEATVEGDPYCGRCGTVVEIGKTPIRQVEAAVFVRFDDVSDIGPEDSLRARVGSIVHFYSWQLRRLSLLELMVEAAAEPGDVPSRR